MTETKAPACPYDVIIAGAGLTGASLALHLVQHDLRVAIVEEQAMPGDPTALPERVIALSCGTRKHLHALDVWPDIERLGAALIRCVKVKEIGNIGEVHMRREHAKEEALGFVVQTRHILKVLHARLQGKVDLFCPARAIGLHVEDKEARLVVDHQGTTLSLAASLLVGADGTYSSVRRLSGIPCGGWEHNRFGLVASITPERGHRGTAFECFCASGPLAFLPLDDRRCSIVWTLAPAEASRLLTMDDAAFLVELGAAGGGWVSRQLGRMIATGPRTIFPFAMRQALHSTARRTVLVGNALHTLHPVAGQGLNLGMRDVAVLADVLTRTHALGRDLGAAIVLAEYGDRRALDNTAVVAFTEGVNALFSNRFLPLRLARGLGLAGMQRLPLLRDFLMRHAAGLGQVAAVESRHGG